jgi:chemotaxis protein MotB
VSTARRSRRHRQASESEEATPDERWAVSYADMVTVLFCLFIVLFAVSDLDKGKFEQLANSLAAGFGKEVTEGGGSTEGLILPPETQDEPEVEDLTMRAALELETLEELRERMRQALTAQGLQDTVEFFIDERGLKVGLIGAETFFANNSTDLSTTADAVLDAIGDVIASATNEVSVEGHADYRVAVYPFPTNWELSSGRATQVARFLVEHEAIPGPRVRATGFSDTRPAVAGTTPEALASNRRVDIVVESTEEEQVRILIPSLTAAAAAQN